MHTRLMFCIDVKRDNKDCSSFVAYHICFEVIRMNYQVHAYFTSAIAKIVAPLQLFRGYKHEFSGSC